MTSTSPTPQARARLGRGLRFPPLLPPGFDWGSDAEAVEQAIRTLLLTEPGERLRRPGEPGQGRRVLRMSGGRLDAAPPAC